MKQIASLKRSINKNMTTSKFNCIAVFILAIALIACDKDVDIVNNLKPIESNTGLYDLYLYNTNSYTNTRITDSPEKTESKYSFSPESKKILFNSEGAAYIMNIDGSEMTLLTSKLTYADWSPHDTEIVYVNDGELFLMNFDGSNERQLTNADIGFWKPIWSQDGQKIACCSDSGLCIVTMDGNVKIISKDNTASWYDWSFDSKKLVYSKYISNNYAQIFKYNIDEKSEYQLTFFEKYSYDPYWNPKKDEIIFTSSLADYGSDLKLMNSDGSKQKTIIHKNNINSPCWSPNGKQITFITDNSNLAIIDINGNNYRIINEIPGACMEPLWSPDGKYILYYRAVFYN